MAYEYEHDVINELEQMGADYEINEYFNMSIEVEEVYRKAKSFDELVNFYPQKDEIPSDEFFMMMGYIIEGYKDELKEVYRKAKAYDLLKEDLLINEKVFREQAKNDEVSNIIHGHYTQLLVQAELEHVDDER